MATDGISAALAVRSSVGLELWSSAGLKVPYSQHSQFAPEVSKLCRSAVYSPDGRYLAWTNGAAVQVCTTADWRILHSLPRPKAVYLRFSPAGNYLQTYEMFFTTKDKPHGSPNLFVYDTATGTERFSVLQKRQTGWEPSWSEDETIMALMLGGEAFFYETQSEGGFAKHVKKIGSKANGSVSLAPNPQQPFVAFCVPGQRGAPSQCKIFKYPDLQAAQPVGFRSFYQADSVEMMWNKRGSAVLLLTSIDVDQTGASYYGKQGLHFMSTKGDSYSVQLSKEGSVHAVSWNPNSAEFCVVYGFMPARATFYNLKCDVTHDVGEGDRNSIYYNDFGTLVILAGFGNLGGGLDVWDVQKKKIVSSLRAPDTTQLEWCPDGELFVTATTAPRLRVGNCFKVWHYSGALLHETMWPTGQELYQISWQRFAAGVHTAKPISDVKIEGIKSSQKLASAEPYRPPGARGLQPKSAALRPGQPPKKAAGVANDADAADAALNNNNRNNRRTERNKTRAQTYRKKFENGVAVDASSVSAPELTNNSVGATTAAAAGNDNSKHAESNGVASESSPTAAKTPEEVQRQKRIQLVHKKLRDIAKLKVRKEGGQHLEINQLAKITAEAELQKELADLKLA